MTAKMKIRKETMDKNKTDYRTLPYIKKEQLLNNSDNTWDLFYTLLSKYYEILDTEIEEPDFTDSQRTLMAFNILYGEVTTGGFLELVKNGYGSYIFTSIFSETLKQWGAIEMAVLIDKAKEIYFQNKVELEIARTAQEIFEMYHHYPEFNVLDKEFFRIMNREADKITRYIGNHMSEFAIVV